MKETQNLEIFSLNKSQFTDSYGIQCSTIIQHSDRNGLYPTFCRIPVAGKTTQHSHFEPEIFLIISGTGQIKIDQDIKCIKENDLIRLPPFSQHELINLGTEELVFLSIYSEDFEVPILPANSVVTAAPPTPNGPLHLGHISGPYLASDIMKRYIRLRTNSVRSHSGTDDHQNYVSEKAHSLNLNPDIFRRQMRNRIEKGLQLMQIDFEEFIEPKKDLEYQTKILSFTQRAIDTGAIVKETIDFPYCNHCNHTLVDCLIEGLCPSCNESSRGGCENCGLVVPPQDLLKARCTRCNRFADPKSMSIYTFNLSQHLHRIKSDLNQLTLSPRILQLIERVEKVKDLKVLVTYPDENNSGLKLPESNQTLHVWFEMAAHYEQFATNSTAWIHCFGFDNSFYYLLFIPALLKALNSKAKLPDAVLTNEFLLLDDQKFSTSRGHAIWADEFVGDSDLLRLYLSLNRPMNLQSNFRLDHFQNFAFELKMQLSKLQDRAQNLAEIKVGDIDPSILLECNRLTKELEFLYSPKVFDLRQVSRKILAFIDLIIQKSESGKKNEKLMLHTFATLVAPIMPKTSEQLLLALGVNSSNWIKDWTRTL